jgi:N-acetylglucosaminyl-diphospho-decaprenol L-rhamnosyltransferase
MTAAPEIDVVVVAFRSAEHLRGCVAPLVAAEGLTVIVVDNACPEYSCETVRDLDVTIVAAGRNGGFAAGANLGVAAGTAPAVLLLNPDARITPDGVRRLAADLAYPAIAIVAPRITGPDGELQWSLRRFPRVRSTFAQAVGLHRLLPRAPWVDEVVRDRAAYATGHEVEWASGAALLVRRPLLEALGGLDEGFFMYCEDIDLCRRARARGQATWFEPAATAVHAGGASGERGALAPVLAASRVRLARKHRGVIAAALERAGIALASGIRAVAAGRHRTVPPGPERGLS